MQKWPPVYDAGYHPEPGQDYWFPDIETMDPEEREQTIIMPKLQQQLKYAYAHSGLYQKKGLRTIVQMMEPGSLERTEFKAKRIVDKRDLYDRITHKGFR